MADKLIYSDVLVDNSITNSSVQSNDALDNNSPFSFFDYLKYTSGIYTPAEYNSFYTTYLKNWSNVKSNVVASDAFVASQYADLLRDISLNYTSTAEKKFLSQIDFSNPLDLDIALPFYTKKIKEIIIFYKHKRDTGTFVIERNKIKGTNTSLERSIYEIITQYIFSDNDVAGSAGLNYNIDSIKRDLNVNIEEFVDVYSNYFDLPSAPVDESVIRTELYTFNTNAVDADLFFNKADEVTKEIFGSSIYLTGIPLAVNVALNYNPICSPVNPLTTLINDDNNDLLGADNRIELRKKLFSKYLGSDFYYLSTNSLVQSASGMFIKAENPSGNLLNMQTADIAGVESGQLEKLRDIGLFFKPDKQGILKVSAKKYTYKIDLDLLQPDSIYIFPDPSVYGNVSLNAQIEYPLIYTFDITPEIRNRSNGIAYGDPNIGSDEQSIAAYYSRQQNKSRAESSDIFLDMSDLYNRGIIQKWQTDVYGNQYAMFKDQYGQYFIDNVRSSKSSVKCLHMDGHVFFDDVEGYNFDYSVYKIENDGFTIRTGLSSHTVENDAVPSFILSSSPLYLNYRQFYPYQSCETFKDAKTTNNNKIGTYYNCGSLVDAEENLLPDPISATLSSYPGSGYYYYSKYATGALGSVSPPHHALTDVAALSADLLFSSKSYLSSGDIIRVTGGLLTDVIRVERDDDNSLFIDLIDKQSETKLSPLSGTNEYHPVSYYTQLTGATYIRQPGSSISVPLCAALEPILTKYNSYVREQIIDNLIDFEIYYDSIMLRSLNVIVFDKIAYDERGYQKPSTRNTYYKVDSDDKFNKFSNTFFDEDHNTVTFAIMSQFSELSGSINKIIYPNIYRYDIATNNTSKVWPINTYADVKALSSVYVTSGIETLSANIITITEPKLAYNSKNGVWKLTLIGKDLNNFPYLYDYTLVERNSTFETISGKCYTMTGKQAQTSLWVSPSAQYVTIGVNSGITITSQGIQ